MLDEGMTPTQILETVLEGLDMQITEKCDCRFCCNCDKARVEKALISIGKDELNLLIEEGRTIEVNCHFCNRNYEFTVDELKGMVKNK